MGSKGAANTDGLKRGFIQELISKKMTMRSSYKKGSSFVIRLVTKSFRTHPKDHETLTNSKSSNETNRLIY